MELLIDNLFGVFKHGIHVTCLYVSNTNLGINPLLLFVL